MSDRIAEITVLAEDLRSGRLLRRYIQRTISARNIRLEIAPAGQGSAYDWVIHRYPIETRAHRQRVSKGRNLSGLVVHIDADDTFIEERHQQLGGALRDAVEDPRAPLERISFVVPKRNTETWLYGLTGMVVDENYDFKRDPERRISPADRRRCDERIGRSAEALYALTRPNAPPPIMNMPALVVAVNELKRFES